MKPVRSAQTPVAWNDSALISVGKLSWMRDPVCFGKYEDYVVHSSAVENNMTMKWSLMQKWQKLSKCNHREKKKNSPVV